MSDEFNFDWENVEKRDMDFINLPKDVENPEITIKFVENNPFDMVKGERAQYGKDIYMFKVIDTEGDERVFSTASNRCLVALKEHRPLKGKTLKISKTGEKMDTQYFIDEIKD